MITRRWRESNWPVAYCGSKLSMSIMVNGTPFGSGRGVALSRFGFSLEDKILFQPVHVEPLRLQSLGEENALQFARGLRQIVVPDNIIILAIAPHLFLDLLQPAHDFLGRIR